MTILDINIGEEWVHSTLDNMEKTMIHLLLSLTIVENSSVFLMEFTMFQEIKIFMMLSKKILQLATHQM